ncbi:M13 family metallopeptidase [Flavilitoribacter nigricans]|uniref:Endothelin-converting protein n=1 Tax=Flavilitoribacter nigricans (strain ATCC 23147 / DSM 23189 / NBRC 102662 / NCIMB 1420 / SS-2) TaxID=1122177 RepID=A0A2D0NGF2_FLAN2|nr:M13 family metallopeptidase [Flavilitoribacter nigricans]PHN07249.1 endothelin-converting protein [Flavilitoribacter nigricans DSM 23189 = NBRC 102662]
MFKQALWFLGAILLLAACQPETPTEEAVATPGLQISYMDTTVSPAQDFFKFVNGQWLETTEIPADRGSWGSFNELRKATSDQVLTVLKGAMTGDTYSPGSDQAKAADFYQTAMDTTHLDGLGIEPLRSELEQIDAIKNKEDLSAYLIASAPLQHNALFGMGIFSDLNNSSRNAAYLGAGSLGLPEREYYMKSDDESKALQQKYRDHVARMLQFLDYDADKAARAAEQIYELEYQLAEARMTKEESRNPLRSNNPRSIDQIAELSPAFDWHAYLEGIGAGSVDTIIVSDLDYFNALSKVMTDTDVETLKDYVKWTEFKEAAPYLSTEIDQANFDFYGKELSGTEQMRDRSERVLDNANGVIGEAIGKLYVDAYFPPEAKQAAEEMVENIKIAFGERIKQLDWMSETTKEKALEKLSTFKVKIAYPDEWKDYSDLNIQSVAEGGSYLGNMINATRWNWERDLAKIGKPVDKSEWFMSPQIVNAYYNPLFNEIVFPAAILQPPFYNYKADAAVNYGGVGAVIGHEISHGFDDQGSRFDAEGNLKNWWTDEDRANFEARAKKLVDQYSGYEPLEGVNVNGAFTLGENIGDLGGLNVAYDGLQRHLEEHGDPGLIDGFTPEQRFFISWGTIWRGKYRDDALKTLINTNPHSPGMYRAIGPVSNMTAFYEAFDIEDGDPLFRPDSLRVKIW